MKTICKKIALSITAMIFLCGISFSQEKRKTTLELTFSKKSDLSKTVVAKVSARNELKKFVPACDVPVNFYALKDKEQVFLNKIVSDEHGNAEFLLPKDIPLDNNGFFTITAKIENNNLYEDGEENIHYKDANLVVRINPKDTGRTITAVITEPGINDSIKPMKDVVVKFYVQRLFGDLPLAEDNSATTDGKGEAVFSFPKTIPGDSLGELTVVAKIEGNDQYGNIESRTPVQWGVVVPVDRDPFPRALWAPNAPPQLIITLCVLFGGVWFTYFYVIFQLTRIKKEDGKIND